jgi:hypothetical protein
VLALPLDAELELFARELLAKRVPWSTEAERAAHGAEREHEAVIARVLDPDAAGTLLRIEVGALTTAPLLASSYTPFGVLRVDPERRLYWLAPTSFAIGPAAVATSGGDVAIVTDDGRHELLVRVPTAAADVLKQLTRPAAPDQPAFADGAVRIEGHVSAATEDSDGSIVVRLGDPRRD